MDVVQDSFISAFDKLASFQRDASFKTWLLRITSNRALDTLRARRVRLAVPLDGPGDEAPGVTLPDHTTAPVDANLEQTETSQRVLAALEALPAEQRAVVSLYAGGERTYGQIAEILGIPPGTVMSRLYHARKRLKELVPDLAPPDEE